LSVSAQPAPERHWRLERDQAGLAWLWIDVAERAINTLSEAVLAELDALLRAVQEQPPAGLVIRSAKPAGCRAGADVRAFEQLRDAEQARASIARAHAVFDRLDALAFPTLALIDGHCLGGGLELALACRYRVAHDQPGTRIGLPEVLLGIHPGFGGTARLIRTIGPLPALELMLSGRSLDARRAARIGVVDEAVPARHLEHAARAWIGSGRRPRRAGTLQALVGRAPLRQMSAAWLRRQVAHRVAPAHYPAPFALLDLWRRCGTDERRMLEAEPASVAALVTGASARNLVRVFFLRERLKGLGRDAEVPVRRLHVVGAGTMGAEIAAWCAWRGLTVTVQDRGAQQIAPALMRARAFLDRRLRDRRAARAALDRILPDPAGDGVVHADIVLEAISEDVDAKRALFAALEPRMRADALLATNTSSIRLEELAAGLADPGRLVGLHFFNPVARMELVEVIAGEATSAAAHARALGFAGAIGKLPLPVASSPGFLVNRCLLPYMLEAVCLLEEGSRIEAVDGAARAFGMPMGPVELADTVGLDVCLAVGEMLAAGLGTELPALLRDKVRRGHLGRKVGRGFYEYRRGQPRRARTRAADADVKAGERLLGRFLNEVVACLDAGVVADAQLLDAGIVFGTGFAPFRGGPLAYVRSEGVARVRERLAALAAAHGARFAPHPGWERLEQRLSPVD